MYIFPEKFATLPPEEQDRLMKEYIMELSEEDLKILKKLIENEIIEKTNDQALNCEEDSMFSRKEEDYGND